MCIFCNRKREAGGPARTGIARRELLRAGLILASAPLLPHVEAHAESPAEGALPVSEIAPGVFVHQGRYEMQSPENEGDMANAGFVVGKDAVAVIDTLGSAKMGARFKAAIGAVTNKPIRFVINTHMHPDHVFGNAPFKQEGVTFVANHKLVRGLTARADRYLAINRTMLGPEAFEGIEIVLPSVTVEDKMTLHLGGRSLVLEAQPTAHTDNDLTVTDDATGTMFLGDLLFSGHVPTIDGSILGWLKLIDTLKERGAPRVVPGHGPHAMELPQGFDPEERYLKDIADDCRKLIKEGKTLDEATKIAGFEDKDAWKLFDQYHVRNVTAAFAELEWE